MSSSNLPNTCHICDTSDGKRSGTSKLFVSSAVAVVIALALLWPSMPLSATNTALGPVLQQAQQHGVLKVALRSYSRPSLPGEPLPPEPDSFDWTLAQWLGQQLQVKIEAVPANEANEADVVLSGITEEHPAVDQKTPSGYADEALQLVALKKQLPQWQGFAPGGWHLLLPAFLKSDATSPTVCAGTGVVSAAALQSRGLQPMIAPSAIHAVSDFLAGKCDLLAESPATLDRLLTQDSWRFYERLGGSFSTQGKAHITLRTPDAQSLQWLQQTLRQWRSSGQQQRALASRVSTIALEASLLEDGAICH
ncbi:MAG: hypothetical protein RR283_09660 [Comamonas sp.]